MNNKQIAIDYALEILRSTDEGENVLISPISFYLTLAMTTIGSDGETYKQIATYLNGGKEGNFMVFVGKYFRIGLQQNSYNIFTFAESIKQE